MKLTIEVSDIEKDLLETIIASKLWACKVMLKNETERQTKLIKHELKLIQNFYEKVYSELTKDV